MYEAGYPPDGRYFSQDIEIVRNYLPVSVGERSWDPILAPGSPKRSNPLFLSAVRLVE